MFTYVYLCFVFYSVRAWSFLLRHEPERAALELPLLVVLHAEPVLGLIERPLRDAVGLGLVDQFDGVERRALGQFSLQEADGGG
jgi:hypothetical protein